LWTASTVGTEAVTASVLPLILDMATSLQAQVIVEGIESEAQIRYLTARGEPLLAQGWYFSKPVSEAKLYELMARNQFESQSGSGQQAPVGDVSHSEQHSTTGVSHH
jgi:sensor c-di-GMP phosphodiesterase-like protein